MLKRMLKVILEVLLFLCIIMVSYLTIVRSIFLETANAKTENIDFNKIEELKNYTKEDMHKALDGILKENDLPPKIIDEILEDKEQKQVIDNYIDEVVTAAKNGEEIPSLPNEKIENMINKGIEKYNEKYNTNLSVSKIKNLVNEFAKKADTILKFVNSNLAIISSFKILLNDTLYYSLFVFGIILIVVIAIIYKKEALFSFGGISLFSSIVFLITYFILKIKQFQDIFTFLSLDFLKIKNTFFKMGIGSCILGILFLIIYKIICSHFKKKGKTKVDLSGNQNSI